VRPLVAVEFGRECLFLANEFRWKAGAAEFAFLFVRLSVERVGPATHEQGLSVFPGIGNPDEMRLVDDLHLAMLGSVLESVLLRSFETAAIGLVRLRFIIGRPHRHNDSKGHARRDCQANRSRHHGRSFQG
jgi:hypothetical protein